MTSQEFLATVLPTSGAYCAVEISTAKKEHVFVQTIDELYNAAMVFDSKGYNSFYALATFNDKGKRLTENALKIKSLFLDIDCGDGKGYATKAEAAEALDTFLSTTALAELGTPWIISSGGGLHVYWAFAEEVDISVWKPVAENLKRLCVKQGLKIDAMVTGDAARILRVPDTSNYKQAKPRKVKIMVESSPKTFNFETIAGALKEKMNGSAYEGLPALQLEGKRPKAIPNANSVKLIENSFTLMSTIGDKCGQINYYREHASQDGMEPLWRGILSIAKYCEDGEDEGLALSALHPYEPERHAQKWHAIKGPYACIKLDEANPGVCETCPHFNKITNPLALGREINTNTEAKEIIIESAEPQAEQIVISKPIPPKGYTYGAKGGIFMDKMLEDEDGKKTRKQTMLLPYDLFAMDILNNKKEHLVHMMAFRPEGPVDVLIPQRAVVSKDETVKHLANQNIIAAYGSGNDKHLFEYVRGCVEFVSANKKAVKVPTSCGWQADKVFVYNSRVYYPDGKDVYVPTPDLENINRATTPTGSLDNWKKVFNMLIARREWNILAMSLVGPASLLMKFADYNGCVYHLGSSESGTGKSLSLELAASFFGHPEQYRVTQSTSTVAGQQRQGLLNSLPFIIDETTSKSRSDFEWLPAFLLDLTQGKGKDRMEAGSNKERVNDTTWHLLCLLSSNTHVMDFLSGARKHSSQGEMFRLLELKMSKKIAFTDEEGATLSLLKENYGVVGREFIRWLVKNYDTAKKIVADNQNHIKKEFEANADERFWTAGNACIVSVIQMLGKDYANLIDIPKGPIIDVLRLMVYNSRGIIYGSVRTPEDILNAYSREFFGKFVVVKAVDGTVSAMLGGGKEVDQSLTRSDVAGRVEHNMVPGHIDYFIEEQLLKNHCVAMSYGYSDFKEGLEKLPNYKVKYMRKDMLSKTRGPTMRVNVMHISRPISENDVED